MFFVQKSKELIAFPLIFLTDEVCNAIEIHAKQPLMVRLWRVSGLLENEK